MCCLQLSASTEGRDLEEDAASASCCIKRAEAYLDVQDAQDDSSNGEGILAEPSAEHREAVQGCQEVVDLPQILILQCRKDPGLQT